MAPSDDILDDDFEAQNLPLWAEEGEVLAKFFSPLEAEMAAARLRAEGIHCFLANHTAQSVVPHLQSIVRLHVHPLDAARAREILHEAAISTVQPGDSRSGNGILLVLSILIGLILAVLLVKALNF
jgi:hypothetical protein